MNSGGWVVKKALPVSCVCGGGENNYAESIFSFTDIPLFLDIKIIIIIFE
jgi:hypothetical protein